jgi:hypothetical protein
MSFIARQARLSFAMLAILAVPALSHAADVRKDTSCEQARQNAFIMFELARTDGNVTPYMTEPLPTCERAPKVAKNDKAAATQKPTSQE